MKYMLLMSGTKAGCDSYLKWSKPDLQANMAFMRAFSKELKDSGVYGATDGLGMPDQAKIVVAGKDGLPITDGVFPEAKEFLLGPADVPLGFPIEVRQVMTSAPKEWE